jgi:TPR repeat protein
VLPDAILPKFILPVAAFALLLPPAITTTKPWLEPLLRPQTIIQSDRERVCMIAVGAAGSDQYAAKLVSLAGDTPLKAEVLCGLSYEGKPADPTTLSWYARSLAISGKIEQALAFFSAAADRGDIFSMEVLANYYSHYVDLDEEKCTQYYERLLKMGNVKAALSLGLVFELGTFSKYDYPLAAKYYTIAAEQGNSEAMYRLGQLLEFGLGDSPNVNRARELYLKATQAGQADAISALKQINQSHKKK